MPDDIYIIIIYLCALFFLHHVLRTYTLLSLQANEMLLAGRSLTALEAYQLGLVSQVFWPTTLMQEVMPRVQNMAAQSAKVRLVFNL